MNDCPAPPPHSIKDRIYSIYAPHIPARNKDRFLARLDDPFVPSANPSDRREPNSHPQWVLDTLEAIDALVDPYHPLPEHARKARGAIRLAAMDALSKLQRERRRQDAGALPL